MRSKRIFWGLLTVVAVAALWVLNVEMTYERNVRHIPAAFRFERHADIHLLRAQSISPAYQPSGTNFPYS
jgi:hypothetical protein